MILLWGPTHDTPLAAVHARLIRRGVPVFTVHEERIAGVRIAGDTLELGGARLAFSEVRACYLRAYDARRAPGIAELPDRSAGARHAVACQAELYTWADLAPARVVNRPAAMSSNDSKPAQLAAIAALGFAVPRTLVTTDPDAVRALHREAGELIYKSISGQRSIVSRLAVGDPRLSALACPTQFQEYIRGTDLRVHVIGSRAIGCEIRSAADDYRYARRQRLAVEIRPATLPDELAERCVGLAASLGLVLAGIDLRRSEAGYVCFEVNPSPAFSFFDHDGRIADAVADLLC